jgi:polysaccharide deacetylase family protein (PEP-CTERM system associated)
MTDIVNAMTVDVEDYFQVSAFEGVVPRADWDRIPNRVAHNTMRILELLDQHDAKCTFFMLGWVAERNPELIREIVSAGHELASHGYSHTRVTQQSPTQFREDVTRTKARLEELSGLEVRGYRAASYSIGTANLWALDVLAEVGHSYSSSIYPIKHDLYGIPDAPRFKFYPRGANGVLEIPVTTVELGGRRFPCGGGGFFRLYPYALSRWAIRHVNESEAQSALFYFHPWEIDPDQPRQGNLSMKTRVRHYINLARTEGRLSSLLTDFRWDRMDRVFLDAEVVDQGAVSGAAA